MQTADINSEFNPFDLSAFLTCRLTQLNPDPANEVKSSLLRGCPHIMSARLRDTRTPPLSSSIVSTCLTPLFPLQTIKLKQKHFLKRRQRPKTCFWFVFSLKSATQGGSCLNSQSLEDAQVKYIAKNTLSLWCWEVGVIHNCVHFGTFHSIWKCELPTYLRTWVCARDTCVPKNV